MNEQDKEPEVIPRVGSLKTSRGVAKELARLYRAARTGKVEPGSASKLAHILNVLRQTLEASDLEARLEALEARR